MGGPDTRATRHGDPRRGAFGAGLIAAFVALAAGPVPVAAQQGGDPPGPRLTLDLRTGLVVSDNIDRERDPAGTSSVSRTSFGLTYDTRTRTDRLTLQAGGRLEFGAFAEERADDESALQSPYLSVRYSRQVRRSALSLDARYSSVDVGFAEVTDDDGRDLVIDQGTRETARMGATLLLGRDGPVTYEATLRHVETDYNDTVDPDLTDRRVASLSQSLGLALTRTTRLVLEHSYRTREEDDASDTRVTNATLRAGLTHRARSGMTASARLGFSVEEITRTTGGARGADRQEAPVLSFSVAQPRRNGVLSASLSRRLAEQGSRTTLRFGRSLDLPLGELDARLGLTSGESDDELRVVGRLSYARPTPRGGLSLALSQQVTSNEETDFLRTTARLDYRHEITRLSQLRLTMSLDSVDAVADDVTDRQRGRLELAYSRQLDADWSLNLGVRHRTARETDRDAIVENAIFANVSRRFDLTP